ncbi:MAG: hypothetical protein ACTSQF_15350 [Candidatus Heimdallarchaeaceae archaeon]
MSFKEHVKEAFTAKKRFGWLDQFRGLVILLFIIQVVASALVRPETGFFPIFAPHINHGWKYVEISNWPPMITLIDVGKHIFIFLVGFMAAFSINKMLQKERKWTFIAIRILRRVILLLVFSVIVALINGETLVELYLLDNTLAYIAWVGLIVAVVTLFVRKADYRFISGLVLFTTQFILDILLEYHRMWNNLMGLAGIGLVASAFASWMIVDGGTVDESSFKKRILPISVGSFVVMFVLEFFQWADHENSTVPICAIAIGISGLALFLFYQMEKFEFKIPILSPLGKNMLLVFILEMVLIEMVYLDLFLKDFIANNFEITILHMLLAGLIPILVMYGIAKGIEKLNLYIRL